MPALFWDGRAESLEAQALQPVTNRVEMGETWDHVVEKLSRHPDYPILFAAAFGDGEISSDRVAKAIAQFERTLISGTSRFDRFLNGEGDYSEEEALGFELFNSEIGDCFHCHGTVLMTDNQFHNNGLDSMPADSGLAAVTGNTFDLGKFKSPSLRNVEYTAPYMHDGRFDTLEEVLEFYSEGFHKTARTDPLLRARRHTLTAEQQRAIVAFVKTLSDPRFLRLHRR
jgi:cytochrome c peroxidase